MAAFAYDDDATERSLTLPVPLAAPARSETRLRVPPAYGMEMAAAVGRVERVVTPEHRDIVTFLEAVTQATTVVEERIEDIGALHVTRTWLVACGEWLDAVTHSLTTAYGYAGDERRVALELVAEESSMRLLMRLERESAETATILKTLDATAARAAEDLAATMELADRMLHALAERR